MKLHIDFLLTLTTPMTVAKPKGDGETVKRFFAQNNRLHEIPYLPSNGIRGRMRRAVSRRIIDHLVAQEGPISVQLFQGLTTGAPMAKPNDTERKLDVLFGATQNAMAATFGGGGWVLPSAFQVTDLIPVTDRTVSAGLVPTAFVDKALRTQQNEGAADTGQSLIELTYEIEGTRKDPFLHMEESAYLDASLANANESIAKYLQEGAVNRGKNAEEKGQQGGGGNKTDTAAMFKTEVIAAGTPMSFSLDLDENLSPEKIGLVLVALEDALSKNSLGGRRAIGLGRFRIDRVLFSRGVEGGQLSAEQLYGQIQLENQGIQIDAECLRAGRITLTEGRQDEMEQALAQGDVEALDCLDGWMAAGRAVILTFTVANLTPYYTSLRKDDKAAKKGKNKADAAQALEDADVETV